MEKREIGIDLQAIREKYIRTLDLASNSSLKAKELAEDLFSLDLTVYSRSFSFDSAIYNSFAQSVIDESIFLHPEQINIINEIEKNDALIVSAPTSFGKTFSVFEYIARRKPTNIVLVVPTLALVDEYLKKILKKYSREFSSYNIYTSISEDKEFNFNRRNIFILTHDRVVNETSYRLIKEIDLMIIDEVYKLEKDVNNDRVLILNLAYLHLSRIAKKYILLAPFIKNVEDKEALEKKPKFFRSSYSPVVNDVEIREILNEKDRNIECSRLLREISKNEKTLIYFPTVSGIYKYIKIELENEQFIELDSIKDEAIEFINWAKEEIHEEWYLVKALERGYLVHNGQLPIGIRLLQMDLYEDSELFTRMLCTSTLLEGVNTTAKNIIITQPSRMGIKSEQPYFSDFDFYNLVGRTGRLYKHYLGKAYYIKSPNDPDFRKENALRSIKFELTDESIDIDIQNGEYSRYKDFIDFLNNLQMDYDEYMSKIGGKPRFYSVLFTYKNYLLRKKELIKELHNLRTIPKYGRYKLICLLYFISEGKENSRECILINELINKQRKKLKTIINNTIEKSKNPNIDDIISTVLRLKNSYIEHKFFSRILLVKIFMEKEGISEDFITVLDDKVIKPIEFIYFSSSKAKKMLIDLGIYERDVSSIINIIGDDIEDTNDLRLKLRTYFNKLTNVSYLSMYIIRKLI